MPYLSTHKTDAKYFTEQPCEHCPAVIKSTRGKTGARTAYLRHLKSHHPEQCPAPSSPAPETVATHTAFRQYPATSTPPETQPDAPTAGPTRFTAPCPYCAKVVASSRDYLLGKVLLNHKRNEHPDELLTEILNRRAAWLDAPAEPLVKAEVSAAYYPRATLRAKHPAPATVYVPARWGVTRVCLKLTTTGHFLAYPERLGVGEPWRVG